MAGVNNLQTRTTWEAAVACYTRAFRERKLASVGKIPSGQHTTIENIRYT